jgi:hypothetical protein
VKQESEKKPKDNTQDRRKSSVQEEKKRGQRLFGGLLSTLSQSTPNGQQKRRLEIEKRQAERAKQQKLDDETRKAEKLAKLNEIRKTEQIKFDEESVSWPKFSGITANLSNLQHRCDYGTRTCWPWQTSLAQKHSRRL